MKVHDEHEFGRIGRRAALICAALGLITAALLCGDVCVAQKKEAIRADWLALDDANIERLLPQLERQNPLTLVALEKIFGRVNVEDVGFGGRTFRASQGGGYTSLSITGFVFNDKMAYYTIAVNCSSSWPKASRVVIEAWKRISQLEFVEGQYGITNERTFPDVVGDYKRAVARELGEMTAVTVSPDLKDAYEVLTALGESLVLSEDVCGYAAVTPRGKAAIDAIVAAGRFDLLSNILKGHNAGGRVYAALALTAMQRKGAELPADVQRTMRIVRALDMDLKTCSGCIGGFMKTERILAEWRR